MVQAIVTNPTVKRELMKIKTHALMNIIDLRKGLPKGQKPVGDNPRHVMVSGNTRIVYSVEIQPNPKLGRCHHLSVSIDNKKTPHPQIVEEVMGLLGMGKLEDKKKPRHISIENDYAINILQKF